MILRYWPGVLGIALFSAIVSVGHAESNKHRRGAAAVHKTHTDPVAQARHLQRLAKLEKAEWRAHLQKVKSLPRKEQVALKRHDLRAKKKALEAQALSKHQAKLAHSHLAALAHASLMAKRPKTSHATRLAALAAAAHNARVAEKTHTKQTERIAALASSAQKARLAAKKYAVEPQQIDAEPAVSPVPSAKAQRAAALRLAQVRRAQDEVAAHNARLAAHMARLAAHLNRLAAIALQSRMRATNLQAAHNAMLAEQKSHWVALHGDGSGGRSIRFWETEVVDTPVKVITVDLNDSNVKVSAIMSRNGSGSSEPFRQMIQRSDPNVAVTGTFFSLDNLEPIGDIVIDGNLVHFGGMGTALCITPTNEAHMVTCTWGRHHDWSPYDFVCACGPRLLENGNIVLDPAAERFRDQHMLAPNSRIAVGITRSNKIVFAMTHEAIYLGRMAKVMHALGASEAMNLDAGTSTGFYYNGATLARPGRKLTNMIVVYGRKDRYEHALDQLLPVNFHRMDHRQISMLPK